jgi:hypothetical protein
MSLRDDNLRAALLKAFADWIDTELATFRGEHRDMLVDRYHEEGIKSFDVLLPDGAKVATISLSIPKDKVEVTDTAALIEWARDNDPALVRTVHHDPVPAHTTEGIDPKRLTELLARVKTTTDGVIDPDTGVLVDGLTHQPGGDPKSYSVRFTDDGREDIGTALRAGALAHLLAGTPLAIGVDQ